MGGVLLAWGARAQDLPAADRLGADRIGQIAIRGSIPERLTAGAQQELDRALDALRKKQIDPALAHWRDFLRRHGAGPGLFDPGIYVDYLLNRLAAARNAALGAACRKLQYYDRQENAVFEHLSTVDKQLSAYGGADSPEVPLREPQLADYGEGVEPVTLPAGVRAGVPELNESLRRWRARLPEISRAREAARTEFERSLRADAPLVEEILAIEAKLRGELKEIVVREK
jgi:hypothetical protein